MSLSTLLEAAKYLDYLDSNNQRPNQQQQQHQPQASAKKPSRRQRSSKKDAANTMVAMSLPTTRSVHIQGVPIPHASGASHQAASLSSSFATDSPLSSFASTALLCSKASEVASASSSAASSLSSSDSSSSCGEILMGDNDFNQSPTLKSACGNGTKAKSTRRNYHKSHRKIEGMHQFPGHHQYIASSPNNQSIARYIAATSAGPQLVTMTSSYAMNSASAPADGHIRAGHVIHAANAGAILSATNTPTGSSFEPKYFSTIADGNILQQPGRGYERGHAFSLNTSSFGSDDQLSGSAPSSSCPPLIMARVQPMILNSVSPSAQGIMAFQPATASSPTSSSSSYSRHRELHKTLEKNRRAHLRHCFEILKAELPTSECADKKTSHINIIKSAIRYVLALREQECEIENELQRLTKIKSELTENLSKMRSLQQSETHTQQQIYTSASNNPSHQESKEIPSMANSLQGQRQQQQPVAEQQLSFLLSQSKLD